MKCANANCTSPEFAARGKGPKARKYCSNLCMRAAASRRHYLKFPEKVNAANDERRRRLLRVPREAFLSEQGGVCAICKTDKPGGKYGQWALDHDHRFPQSNPEGHRGVLCHRCNAALGIFGDTLDGLMRAVRYLERYESAHPRIKVVA